MSAPLSSAEQDRYTRIIDGILAEADLETISRKKIRQGLEAALGGKDLSEQKEAIKDLIVSRFDAISSNAEATQEPEPSPQTASAANGVSDHGTTDPSASPEPARKKVKRSSSAEDKRSSSVEDADRRLAAQLQAQENSLARGRATRGGGEKKAPKKKAPKKKSAKKVKAADDSDVDGSDASGTVRKRKAGGGFQKPFMLSPALSELTGETQLSRPGVVKSLWKHIKAHELQDPSDKRQIICDEKMQAVFRVAKVDMFKMNKEISNHLYPVEEA